MQIACAKCAMRRCNNAIAEFDTLPDAALVNLKPVYIGSQSVRWRVGDVREYLAGEKTVK